MVVRLACATFAFACAFASPASAQICPIPSAFEFPCNDGQGCFFWLKSHDCYAYGSPDMCQCWETARDCCGQTVWIREKVSCSWCVGPCDGRDSRNRSQRLAANQPPKKALFRNTSNRRTDSGLASPKRSNTRTVKAESR